MHGSEGREGDISKTSSFTRLPRACHQLNLKVPPSKAFKGYGIEKNLIPRKLDL
jgi:hypothetical protein